MEKEFILDTGFSGDLKIDPSIAQEVGVLDVSSRMTFLNANGEYVMVDVVYCFAEMEGRRAPIRLLIGNGMSLAGSGLFSVFGYRLTIDYKNKTVHLEQIFR